MAQYIDKELLVAGIEKMIKKYSSIDVGGSKELEAIFGGKCHALIGVLSFLDTLDVKEDKEMPTSGECVTLSKERYQELLEYESVALWAFNVIIVASLPSIENEKLEEISNDAKLKAIQAAFNEALKNKEK